MHKQTIYTCTRRSTVSDDKQEPEIVDVTPVVREDQTPEKKSGGWFSWFQKKPKSDERQIKALQQGFSELVDLTRSIREHMDQQTQTQKAVVDLMKHLPGAVEGLQQMGKATEQQSETLALLRRQLESAGRNEEQIVESFRNFNRTLELMDEMSKSTSQTVTSMSERTRDSEEMLRNILERSEKRLMYMIVGLMGATILVLGVGLYIGMGGGERQERVPEPQAYETMEEGVLPLEIKKTITDLNQHTDEEAVEDEQGMDTPVIEERTEDAMDLIEDVEMDNTGTEARDEIEEGMDAESVADEGEVQADDVELDEPVEEDVGEAGEETAEGDVGEDTPEDDSGDSEPISEDKNEPELEEEETGAEIVE